MHSSVCKHFPRHLFDLHIIRSDPPPVYPEVIGILQACKSAGIQLAVASKSPATDTGIAWLRRLAIHDIFKSIQIFSNPGKQKHFRNIKAETGVTLSEMLFFDDEAPNIRTLTEMGVASIHVPSNGLSMAAFKRGLEMFASKSFTDDRGFGSIDD